jgi:hypothetical protein
MRQYPWCFSPSCGVTGHPGQKHPFISMMQGKLAPWAQHIPSPASFAQEVKVGHFPQMHIFPSSANLVLTWSFGIVVSAFAVFTNVSCIIPSFSAIGFHRLGLSRYDIYGYGGLRPAESDFPAKGAEQFRHYFNVFCSATIRMVKDPDQQMATGIFWIQKKNFKKTRDRRNLNHLSRRK